MSSTSPSKEPEVEPEAQSGEEHEQMEKEQDQTQGQGEFEVKEQDRWLPIANGELRFLAATRPSDLRVPCDCRPAPSSCVPCPL